MCQDICGPSVSPTHSGAVHTWQCPYDMYRQPMSMQHG
jgi:hypothetical protein